MTPNVIQVTPLPNYQLDVLFENGERRLFDMNPYLVYPAFSLLMKDVIYECAY